jgi:ubiquinone biosynthesis protein COQ9
MGAVYTSTELFLLTDGSPQFADTWRFLHRSTQVRVAETL